MDGKIFVRERRKVEKGEKKPRFRVVGVSGVDLKLYIEHARKQEIDRIAQEIGAQVVVLTAGKEEKGKAQGQA